MAQRRAKPALSYIFQRFARLSGRVRTAFRSRGSGRSGFRRSPRAGAFLLSRSDSLDSQALITRGLSVSTMRSSSLSNCLSSALGYRLPTPESIVAMDRRPTIHKQLNRTTRCGQIDFAVVRFSSGDPLSGIAHHVKVWASWTWPGPQRPSYAVASLSPRPAATRRSAPETCASGGGVSCHSLRRLATICPRVRAI